MAAEKRICEKCKKERYCDEHHVLSKEIFGEGEVILLCKTCHDLYHRALGHKYLQKKNAQSIEFYLLKWYTWLYLGIFIGLLWVVLN